LSESGFSKEKFGTALNLLQPLLVSNDNLMRCHHLSNCHALLLIMRVMMGGHAELQCTQASRLFQDIIKEEKAYNKAEKITEGICNERVAWTPMDIVVV
jgi:hypothetical protein